MDYDDVLLQFSGPNCRDGKKMGLQDGGFSRRVILQPLSQVCVATLILGLRAITGNGTKV